MKIEIQEVLETLQSDITEKENQINLIKTIDWTKSVTEKEWHQICETLLRTSDLLCNLLKNTFPNATDIQLGMNHVDFNLYGFKCKLPTSRYEEIRVDMSWNKNIKEPTLQNINLYPELFLRINPVVINKCKKIDQKLTSDLIERITNQVLVELNQKENKDSIQRDFIQILVLNQLINK